MGDVMVSMATLVKIGNTCAAVVKVIDFMRTGGLNPNDFSVVPPIDMLDARRKLRQLDVLLQQAKDEDPDFLK